MFPDSQFAFFSLFYASCLLSVILFYFLILLLLQPFFRVYLLDFIIIFIRIRLCLVSSLGDVLLCFYTPG
jgi:hypothetical protein